jgi:hypothetical protein
MQNQVFWKSGRLDSQQGITLYIHIFEYDSGELRGPRASCLVFDVILFTYIIITFEHGIDLILWWLGNALSITV